MKPCAIYFHLRTLSARAISTSSSSPSSVSPITSSSFSSRSSSTITSFSSPSPSATAYSSSSRSNSSPTIASCSNSTSTAVPLHSSSNSSSLFSSCSYSHSTAASSSSSSSKPHDNRVVLVTGCDSGLGFSTVRAACSAGLRVLAGVLGGHDSEGARLLRGLPNPPDVILPLDVTSDSSVEEAMRQVTEYLLQHPERELHAVVNNAGVMVFGEAEWQTAQQLEQQVMVNILGSWRVSRAALPLLRRSSARGGSPRLVQVGSHCSLQPLPLLAPYAATKAAARAWTEAVRMELLPHGVKVVYFIPGSLVASTRIMANQNKFTAEMRSAFTAEQTKHYGEHFELVMSYLSGVGTGAAPDVLEDPELMRKMVHALTSERPRPEYKHQPWRYAIYHFLFEITPRWLRTELVHSFVKMPRYNKK